MPPDESVYTQRMSLRYARVNDVPDSIFKKEGRTSRLLNRKFSFFDPCGVSGKTVKR